MSCPIVSLYDKEDVILFPSREILFALFILILFNKRIQQLHDITFFVEITPLMRTQHVLVFDGVGYSLALLCLIL